MIFLVDKKNRIIIQTNNTEKAESIVIHNKESDNPNSFEIIGASDKRKFEMFYPEYVDFCFVDANNYLTNKKTEDFFNKAMDNDIEFQKLINRVEKENENG